MNTKAVRIYGKMDLRLDDVQLPDIGPDGVRIRVISDSLCMSSYMQLLRAATTSAFPTIVMKTPLFWVMSSVAIS